VTRLTIPVIMVRNRTIEADHVPEDMIGAEVRKAAAAQTLGRAAARL